MAVTIIKDGQVIHSDVKVSLEDRVKYLETTIADLQNQIKDLKSKKRK